MGSSSEAPSGQAPPGSGRPVAAPVSPGSPAPARRPARPWHRREKSEAGGAVRVSRRVPFSPGDSRRDRAEWRANVASFTGGATGVAIALTRVLRPATFSHAGQRARALTMNLHIMYNS